MDVILWMNWWLLLMRGVAALLLGILIVILPDMRLSELALVFFGYAMIDAVANAAGAMDALQQRESWGLLLFQAAAGFAAGLLILAWPGLPMRGLIYIISGWGLAMGTLGIISAATLSGNLHSKWLLAATGMASIVLGMVMVAAALAGPSAIEFWLGAYALIFGALLVGLALRVRALVEAHRTLDSRRAA